MKDGVNTTNIWSSQTNCCHNKVTLQKLEKQWRYITVVITRICVV